MFKFWCKLEVRISDFWPCQILGAKRTKKKVDIFLVNMSPFQPRLLCNHSICVFTNTQYLRDGPRPSSNSALFFINTAIRCRDCVLRSCGATALTKSVHRQTVIQTPGTQNYFQVNSHHTKSLHKRHFPRRGHTHKHAHKHAGSQGVNIANRHSRSR